MSIFNRKPAFDPNMVDNREAQIKQQADEATAEAEATPTELMNSQNPFELARYNQFRGQDQPVAFGNNMAEALLSDEGVPDDIKTRNWNVFLKDNVLTFLDVERKNSKMLNYDISRIDILNCTPYYNYTFEQEHEFGVMRNVFETKLDRALGTSAQIKNERTTLQSQFSEVKQINEMSNNEVTKSGFLRRLLGRK